ncbi:Aspartyl/glutamyl-tRNA(Asn/Gln) amidotransferase subunit C [Candidatus Desulfarcum epimagneticum]|uniref:Aspartyl/glutamyl-tRNA(Asn/Gln) amidotransferase subunit C n=1 Tax=uncultured Desulfobacteraceae bacterium TaxID=218296 RepID=A0A484HKB6_9BACT|nr:Aspartyl/glutamyl-tRNA(Asn/Gln) amidotransferase subunit C [uncultured Desulfobacteraceae bacterium]
MKITEKEIVHVAELARLDLSGESMADFARQIGEILEYVDTLAKADTEGVAPTFHAVSLTNALRDDEKKAPADRDALLANAPEEDEGLFVAPKIIE